MKCIFKRQATSANTPIKLEFDVAGIEYLVKNFTQGDIYVALEETSNKNDCLLTISYFHISFNSYRKCRKIVSMHSI